MGWVSLASGSLSHREELTLTPHRGGWELTPPQPGLLQLPLRAHGQGRFSSELGLRWCCLKYHGATRLWLSRALGTDPLPSARAPSQTTQSQGQCYSGRDSTPRSVHLPGDIQTALLAQRCLALPDHSQLPDAKQRVNSLLNVSRDIPSPGRGGTSPPSKQEFA